MLGQVDQRMTYILVSSSKWFEPVAQNYLYGWNLFQHLQTYVHMIGLHGPTTTISWTKCKIFKEFKCMSTSLIRRGIVLAPAWTSNVLSGTMPMTNSGLSWSWNIVVVTPISTTTTCLNSVASAESNVCTYWSLGADAPTLILNVFVVTLLTVRYRFAAGSVARG